MLRIVQQSIVLSASPRALYAMYLSPAMHGAITGGKVSVGARPGAKFRAFGGALAGRTLHAVPGRLIVQAWRSSAFHKGDHDSTLILRFLPAGRNRGRIDLVHVNVPSHDYRGVEEGWKNYYWKPWRKFLARKQRSG
ncbi:MAG: SRPBCC domain-containing protein [Betaproteobacteria bacterium]|nr:SRPBCC domain-containing protein [Betaproteobacteria bacterium]